MTTEPAFTVESLSYELVKGRLVARLDSASASAMLQATFPLSIPEQATETEIQRRALAELKALLLAAAESIPS